MSVAAMMAKLADKPAAEARSAAENKKQLPMRTISRPDGTTVTVPASANVNAPGNAYNVNAAHKATGYAFDHRFDMSVEQRQQVTRALGMLNNSQLLMTFAVENNQKVAAEAIR